MPDLIAGRLSFTVQPSPALVPLIKSGRLKRLAVMSRERIGPLPEVPTTAEAGRPDLIYNAGICLYVPGRTPRSSIKQTQLDARIRGRLLHGNADRLFEHGGRATA